MASNFKPKAKERGNVILAQDWNTAMTEIVRLGVDSLTVTGGTISGDVIANGKFGIGIGTAAPTAKLEVNGDIKTDRAIINDGGWGSAYAAFSHKDKGTKLNYALLQHSSGTTYLNAASGRNIHFRINNADKMALDQNGNLGIGTKNPQDKLDLNGALRFNGNADRRVYGAARTAHNTVVLDGHWDELEVKGRVIEWTGSNLHIGFSNNHASHSIEMGRNVGNIRFLSGGGANETMRITDGKVGIGTDGPIQKLDVNGRMNVEQGVIQRGGAAINNTRDLGLYSRVSGNWIRLVTKNGRIAFYSDDGAGTSPNLTVEANGNVGIGTGLTAPTTKLEVNGTVKATKFEGDGSALKGLNAVSNTGGTITGDLIINKTLTVTGEVTAASFVGDGSKLTGIATASTSPWTDLPDAAGAKGVQYKAGKTVTIGAANSGAKLHILNKNQDAKDGDSLVLGKTDTTSASLRLGYHGDYAWVQSNNKPLAINPTGGHVGIGTEDPKSALDVVGYIVMHKPAVDDAADLVKNLPNSSLIVAGPNGDSLVFYWKDETGKEYALKLQGTVKT